MLKGLAVGGRGVGFMKASRVLAGCLPLEFFPNESGTYWWDHIFIWRFVWKSLLIVHVLRWVPDEWGLMDETRHLDVMWYGWIWKGKVTERHRVSWDILNIVLIILPEFYYFCLICLCYHSNVVLFLSSSSDMDSSSLVEATNFRFSGTIFRSAL